MILTYFTLKIYKIQKERGWKMKNKLKKGWLALVLVLPLLTALLGFTSQTEAAKTSNIQDKGSLTIHKLLNPEPTEYKPGGSGTFIGDGTESGANSLGGAAITGEPLPGVTFKVVGPLTKEQAQSLQPNYPEVGTISQDAATKFMNENPTLTSWPGTNSGVTDSNGIVTFADLPVKQPLDENIYLVVETGMPTNIDAPSAPVLVNIPVTAIESSDDQYNYDVHLFMKNYASTEPSIAKEVDKTSTGTGDIIPFTIRIKDLPDDLDTFHRLEVFDPIDARLTIPSMDSIGEVVLKGEDGTEKVTFSVPGDVEVTIGKLTKQPAGYSYEADQYIYWNFTTDGLKKLKDATTRDDYIELPFTAIANENSNPGEAIPNKAQLGFENQYGHGTKPVDPEKPEKPGEENPSLVPPKPSENVNVIYGKKDFIKTDKKDGKVLAGAEFILKDTVLKAFTAKDKAGNSFPVAADETIYAIVKDGRVVGWTKEKTEASTLTSGADGTFSVEGLSYNNIINFKQEYLYGKLGDALDKDGKPVDPAQEVITGYTYFPTNEKRPGFEGPLNTSDVYPAEIESLGDQVHQYALEETKAPDGYVKLTADIPFNVEPGEGKADGQGVIIYGDTDEVKIENTKLPSMPITGGMGTIIFLIAGLGFIGTAYFVRQRKNA